MTATTRIAAGFLFPVYVNETATKQRIAPSVYVNETVVTGTNVNLTGVQGTGSAGSFSVTFDTAITLTGVQGTGSVGTFSIAIGPQVNLTGVQGTGSAGTFTIQINASLTLTGVQGTGSAGIITTPTLGVVISNFTFADRVFQRNPGGTTKDINISGTYTGGLFTSLNATVNIVAGGTALTTACTNVSASGGTWTATIPAVPQGAWYKATVTEPLSTNSGSQTVQWGVGINILCIGQSNMWYMWVHSPGGVSNTYSRRWNGNGWFLPTAAAQPFEIDSPQGGQGIVTLLNNIRTAVGGTVPVAALEYAIAGTQISSWLVGGSSWTALVSSSFGLNKAGMVPEFEFVLWHQGESDSVVGKTPQTYYAADLALVYTQCQTISNRSNTTLKFGVAMMGATIGTSNTDANDNTVRAIHWDSSTTTTGMFFSGSTLDLIHLLNDEYHWTGPSLIRAGERYANAVNNQLGLSANGSQGPRISSAYWAVGTNQIIINVQQLSGGATLLDGTGSSTGTGLTTAQSGFVVTASGGQTVSSLALSAGTVVITMSANRGVGETVTFTYGQGKNPWVWVADPAIDTDDYLIYDNNSTLIGDTLGLPLLPTAANSGGNITVQLTNPAIASGGNAWIAGVGKMMNR